MAINLNKISLDKTSASAKIDLTKTAEVKVTLRWNKSGGQPKGFFASLLGGGDKEIDLDLGACVELASGEKFLMDPLQSSFQAGNKGSLTAPPYILHSGDDRAGGGGEVIRIGGLSSSRIRQIWVYAFIYEGVARWSETDAVVIIEAPGQPTVEIPLGQQSSNQTFCALGHLAFAAGSLEAKRLVTFHGGHAECDTKYGWGFRWRSGSK